MYIPDFRNIIDKGNAALYCSNANDSCNLPHTIALLVCTDELLLYNNHFNLLVVIVPLQIVPKFDAVILYSVPQTILHTGSDSLLLTLLVCNLLENR